MKEKEKIDWLKSHCFSEFAGMYGKVFDDLSETQPIFCVCGKLATGIHERTCKKFNNKVEREVLRRLAHLLPYYFCLLYTSPSPRDRG